MTGPFFVFLVVLLAYGAACWRLGFWAGRVAGVRAERGRWLTPATPVPVERWRRDVQPTPFDRLVADKVKGK